MDFVYLIHAIGTDYYKIGRTSKTPEKRMRGMQTGCPHELEVVDSLKTEYAEEKEERLHARYSDKREQGEWFSLSDEEVTEIREDFRGKRKHNFLQKLEDAIIEEMPGSFSGLRRTLPLLMPLVLRRVLEKESGPQEFVSVLLEEGFIDEEAIEICQNHNSNNS